MRLRRLPRRVLRSARHSSLLVPRRDLLLPRRERLLPRRELRRPGSLLPGRAAGTAETSVAASASAVQDAGQTGRRRSPWPVVAAATVGWILLGLVLYSFYLHLSRTVPANSDGAGNVLQAWDMLHGNPLLRGWVLSDVTFYTTELPQYMLIELVRGLSPDVTHIAAAMTYTILVLLAARLAKGSATGPEGLARAGIAAGIMLAPPQSSVSVLLIEPDHIGSAVPVLLILLLLDRAGRRWFVPPAVLLLVGWALVADQVILITAAGPIAFVALSRAYIQIVRLHRPLRNAWFDLALAVATGAGVFAGERALALISSSGGFTVYPVSNQLAPFSALPTDALAVLQGLLVLFGADFPGRSLSFLTAVGLLHLVGAALVIWAVCVALRRFARSKVAIQVLAVSVTFSLLAYLLGPNAALGGTSREFAAVLPLGAALAGRVLARKLRRVRMMPAMSAILGLYIAGLVIYAGGPAAPAANQALATWLTRHKLQYGLADYSMANSVTVDSGGKVDIRAIRSTTYRSWPNIWETKPAWYSPAQHVANFVVMPSSGPGPWFRAPSALAVTRTFGQPAKVYLLADYTVLVWNINLLSKLTGCPGQPPGTSLARCSGMVGVG